MLRGVVGVFGPLTTLLIILKLVGAINLGWIWVFSPLWIRIGFVLIVYILSYLFDRK